MDSNSNRKNQRKNRENRWQIELKSETLTLTLEVKGHGTYLVRASLPPPVRGTRLRRRSPDFTAQRSRRLAAPGRRGRARGGSRAWLRPRPARRLRAHPPASARAGEHAAVAPPCPLRPATMASGRLLHFVEREDGEGENEP